ncbi:hypothetical protein Fleli_3956 [Bernardetia litoralis DSM 6794]|uniref:MepB protein n=1 Tax=Bernardetia litoralis (strain ATCC 23117 / DSM 6794 / NBRC 15988 / NCIMB 1366 / Fx l1 / Sio-4) TaxID=880071 RepID=I4AQM3_BERLS|nr:MepB family protein [Bernardetia litoralis]AFM06258.1 hypothetical protein Fleli_3956 [Bernardetia litoralis DSM 6794]
MSISEKNYSQIENIDKLLFQKLDIELSDIKTEKESQDYFAHTFKLNQQNIRFRKAKITPKKTGQFVAIWKRNKEGITEPFDIKDDFDFYMITTEKEDNFGIFIFSKAILLKKGILSNQDKNGKRGIRVYPIWDETISKQAQKTQKWQLNHFLNLSDNIEADLQKAEKLLLLGKQN